MQVTLVYYKSLNRKVQNQLRALGVLFPEPNETLYTDNGDTEVVFVLPDAIIEDDVIKAFTSLVLVYHEEEKYFSIL